MHRLRIGAFYFRCSFGRLRFFDVLRVGGIVSPRPPACRFLKLWRRLKYIDDRFTQTEQPARIPNEEEEIRHHQKRDPRFSSGDGEKR